VKVEYNGRDRYTLRGALTYPSGPPPIGTILGKTDIGEYVTVVAHQDGKALCAVTISDDGVAARQRPTGPASVTEHRAQLAGLQRGI
jgi:hypothetical protein